MIPLLGSALAGIQQAGTMAASSASALASSTTSSAGAPDVARDFVTLTIAGAEVAIGAKVARAEQETQKALLDIMA